jgi:hypothetical protein
MRFDFLKVEPLVDDCSLIEILTNVTLSGVSHVVSWTLDLSTGITGEFWPTSVEDTLSKAERDALHELWQYLMLPVKEFRIEAAHIATARLLDSMLEDFVISANGLGPLSIEVESVEDITIPDDRAVGAYLLSLTLSVHRPGMEPRVSEWTIDLGGTVADLREDIDICDNFTEEEDEQIRATLSFVIKPMLEIRDKQIAQSNSLVLSMLQMLLEKSGDVVD